MPTQAAARVSSTQVRISARYADPSVAAHEGEEPICDRISRLSKELGDALAAWHDGQGTAHTFVAYVPSSTSGTPYYLTNQPWRADDAERRLDHHAKEFAKAAKELDPTAEELLVGRAVAELPGGYRFSAIVSAKQEKRGAHS